MSLLKTLADNERPSSLASRLRRRRLALFLDLVAPLARPLRILDVGGSEHYWTDIGFQGEPQLEIHLVNLEAPIVTQPGFTGLAGDARDLRQFRDRAFDVVYSNSVIEHVGSFDDQSRMAREIMRVGTRYFVQTPNRYFPIEPHFLFPGFQFLPTAVQARLHYTFKLGWNASVATSLAEAHASVSETRLLTERQVRSLFPGATLYREKVFGLCKSFVAYGGWT